MRDAKPGEPRLFDYIIAWRHSEKKIFREVQTPTVCKSTDRPRYSASHQSKAAPGLSLWKTPSVVPITYIFGISSVLYSLVSFYSSFLSRGKCRTCVHSTFQRPSPEERHARESCSELKEKSWHHELAWKVVIIGRKRVMQYLLLREWHSLFHTFIQKWLNTKLFFPLSKVKQFKQLW